tara:strand:- start:163 stop:1110 length:948 start_codon:yes stop_codon:yes gene_type:complete
LFLVLRIILNFNEMIFNKYLLAGLVVLTLLSCEDVIDIEVEKGETQLSVDAFINNKVEVQKIVLLETKQFFGEAEQSFYKADSVFVIDDLNNKYIFEDFDLDGVYEWDDTILVHSGRTYNLTVKKGLDIFTSESVSKPVPPIDSVNWQYIPAGLGAKNGSYAVELVSRDLVGQVDYYKIQWAKNGKYVKGISSINLSVDGSFSETGAQDGGLFIPPKSTFPATNFDDSLGLEDTFTYDLLSIDEATFNFWTEVANQKVAGGIRALFATPTANVKSNIKYLGNDKKALGWFSASMISSYSQEIFDKPGERLSFSTN